MATHALQVYKVWAAPRYKPGDPVNLGNIADSGVDFVDFASQMLDELEQAPIKTGATRYTRFTSHGDQGRVVQFKGSAGRYGADGEIFDVLTGQKIGDMDKNHATMAEVRNMMVVPAAGDYALLMTERYAGYSLYSVYQAEMIRLFRDRFDDLVLHFEAQVEPQAWDAIVENLDLEAVAAVVYRRRDRAGKQKPQRIGVLRVERSGWRGSKLSKVLLKAAVTASEPPHKLVGLEEPLPDEAEVHVTVNDGNRTRTIVVGREKWPSVSYVLAPDGEDRPDDDDVYGQASAVAPTLLERLGVDLPPNWMGDGPT